MKSHHNKCLVLNADFSPLTIISWKRAIVWSIKYNNRDNMSIEIIDFYKDDFINGSNHKKIPVPAVVKMSIYRKLYNMNVNFSRKNLFIRDDMKCQYCGQAKDINQLTYDHIIPRSQWDYTNGSPTTWTNVVTACIDCNRKKGNKTPKQASMPLLTLPIKPKKNIKYLPLISYLSRIKEDIPNEWSIYLPPSYLQ